MTDTGPLKVEWLDDGTYGRFTLNRPKGNILDAAMTQALAAAAAEAKFLPNLKAIVIEGAGDHFSFGASIEEHLPGKVEGMLRGFHGLFRELIDLAVPLIAAVRGQCLGGGLELAAFCHRVIASETAKLGQPEIVLGVIAPVGSLVLNHRMRPGDAADLLLSGRSVTATEAKAMGLVDQIADDPNAAALDYAKKAFGDKSAASLRMAVRAARHTHDVQFLAAIDQLERLYLDRLMALNDPLEGLQSFIAKRKPVWKNT